jgi:hypothetical protein
MFPFSKSLIIKPCEVQKVVLDNRLHIYGDIRHYSFGDEFQRSNFWLKKTGNNNITLYSQTSNESSPLLIYTNNDSKAGILRHNTVLDLYNEHNDTERYVFWFLRVQSFEDFLKKRSGKSSTPKKHFPSLESYDRIMSKINGSFEILEFDREYFTVHFDTLKPDEHLCADRIIDLFEKRNPAGTTKLLKTAVLTHNKEITAIALLVDDGTSINLENIAARRDSLSFGVILCTETVKYCCENKYHSFNAGITGIYGGYKQKIFLDSKEVFRDNSGYSKYMTIWNPDTIQKIREKLFSGW